MSMGSGHRLVLLICGLFWQGISNAAVVTVDLQGTINNVTLPANATLDIVNNDTFNATYTYDTTITDSLGANNTAGSYANALTELYINIAGKPYYWHLGQYAGSLTGVVETQNASGADSLTLMSSEASAVAGTALDINAVQNAPQFIQLRFAQSATSPDFLGSDALPLTMPPEATPASVCLRFDSTATNTTPCGSGNLDVVLEFSATNKVRKDRFQWANPLPQGSILSDVIWNDAQQLYVAVGHNGAIISSSNGRGWVNRDVLTKDRILSLAWGNGAYVTVADKALYNSRDGIIWTETDSLPEISSSKLQDPVWDNTQFIVVGKRFRSDMLIYTSQDGVTWMPNSPVNDIQLTKITTNRALYVVLGLKGVISPTPVVLTSTDLITWTEAMALTGITLNDIDWSGSLFAAVGVGGDIYTSENGLDWFPQTSGTSVSIGGVNWANDRFIATGTNGLLLTGIPDAVGAGVSWTPLISDVTVNLHAATFNGQDYIVVGADGMILTSNDAVTWQGGASSIVENFNDSIWTGSQFIAVGNGGYIANSNNGIDWGFTTTSGKESLFGVASDGVGTYVAVGVGIIYRSLDGVIWTPANSGMAGTETLNRVQWVVDKFVAVGQNGLVAVSTDGNDWTRQTVDVNANIMDLSARNNNIVAVGTLTTYAPFVMTSTDGAVWQVQQLNTTENIRGLLSVSWSGNEFLATADAGSSLDLLSSKDGVSWRPYRNGSGVDISYARWIGDQYIGLGAFNGRNSILTSTDAITWTSTPAYFSGDLIYGIATSPSNLIITGTGGGINYKTGTYINNFAPYVDLGPDQSVFPGDTVTVTAQASDDDGETPTVTFEQTTNLPLTDLDSDPMVTTFKAETEGEYIFTLTAVDSHNVTSTATVHVTVAHNQAPVADAGAKISVNSGETVVLSAAGSSDPEGQALSYQWELTDGQPVTLSNPNSVEASFVAPDTSDELNFTFLLTVTDVHGLSASDTVQVSVTAAPPAPAKPAPTGGSGMLLWLLPMFLVYAARNNAQLKKTV